MGEMKSSERDSSVTVEVKQDEAQSVRLDRLNFSNPNERAVHIYVFLAWLPVILREAPDIHWDRLPSKVMGYILRTVADEPDAIPITFAIGCAIDGMKQQTLSHYCRNLTNLFRRFRSHYGMEEISQLDTRTIWEGFMGDRTLAPGEINMLLTYDALSSNYQQAYLEGLSERQRLFWEKYRLPLLPARFLEKRGLLKARDTAAAHRRKDQSDVILPLFPLLVEIAQLRKQAAERLIQEFRRHRNRAMAGEIALPYQFQYTDRQFSIPENAPTISAIELMEQEITLSFTLWDRVSWAQAHPERYSKRIFKDVVSRARSYASEQAAYFLQYHGKPEHLLWFGTILAHRHLGKWRTSSQPEDDSKAPTTFERFVVSRPGLLTPYGSASRWFRTALHTGEMVFEPECLYRGMLFAAALATLALTNGSRLNELLQVSATRFETIVVDELRNQQPTGRKIGILVQHLLPKGYAKEEERQFFLIGEMAGRLLAEIGQLLEVTHGGRIPVVQPHGSSKEEDLRPEPYLFQWDASSDGRLGLLRDGDVGPLLRFLFHGLTLTTRTGKPIRIASHLLRHVLATHARHIKKVPAEAVAYLLHHRVTLEGSTRALTISEATAYYSRMPVEQLLALLFEAQSTLVSHRNSSYLQAPTPHTLEQMDAALRQVFEQWSLIGPTALGFCSAGLCVRPDNRELCLNCQFLVPHYSNMVKAKTWRKLYVLQAQMHEAHGHHVDARQAQQMIGYLDDIIRVMEIQIRARQDGGYLPFADTLPPAQDNEEGDLP